MAKFSARISAFMLYIQAILVLYMDKRFKRDPLVAERLKHFRALSDHAQQMLNNPKAQKQLTAGQGDQLRMFNRGLPMMEQFVKKNPNIKMSDLEKISQNPQQYQQQVVRTRPGPPMRGRRRM
jgi:hypothetical protein